jgi:hypothetical protein
MQFMAITDQSGADHSYGSSTSGVYLATQDSTGGIKGTTRFHCLTFI